jgi:hypothetical protein
MILIVSRTAERMLKRKLDVIGVQVCCSLPATKLRHILCASKDFSELRLGWCACMYACLNITRPLLLSDCNHHWSVSKNISKAPALNVMRVRLVPFENLNYYKIILLGGGCRFWFRKWISGTSSYSGGCGCRYQLGNRLTRTRIFCGFTHSLRGRAWYKTYLKLDYGRLQHSNSCCHSTLCINLIAQLNKNR